MYQVRNGKIINISGGEDGEPNENVVREWKKLWMADETDEGVREFSESNGCEDVGIIINK